QTLVEETIKNREQILASLDKINEGINKIHGKLENIYGKLVEINTNVEKSNALLKDLSSELRDVNKYLAEISKTEATIAAYFPVFLAVAGNNSLSGSQRVGLDPRVSERFNQFKKELIENHFDNSGLIANYEKRGLKNENWEIDL